MCTTACMCNGPPAARFIAMDFGFRTLGPLPGSSRSVCTNLRIQEEGFGGRAVHRYVENFGHQKPFANGESITLV